MNQLYFRDKRSTLERIRLCKGFLSMSLTRT